MSAYDGFLDVAIWADSPLVGALVVPDLALPTAPVDHPVRVVVTGGAGQLAGPVALAARRGQRLVAVEVALRDHDDPAGNARRVAVAAGDAALPDDVLLHVALTGEPGPRWLEAADEVAAVGGALTLDLDGPGLETWIDAALDRELPFSLRGGTLTEAVAALRTTARLWGEETDLVAARRWCRTYDTSPRPR